MSNWSQPQCERCFIAQQATAADGKVSMRLPVIVVDRRIEHCAWCSGLTIAGIYQRVDPTTVGFPTVDAP